MLEIATFDGAGFGPKGILTASGLTNDCVFRKSVHVHHPAAIRARWRRTSGARRRTTTTSQKAASANGITTSAYMNGPFFGCPVLRDSGHMYSGTGHHCQPVRDMNSAIILLDKYKKTCSIASDNACAASLSVSRQAVSKWRNGENHPDADVVEKMCEATGESLARWLPLIESERARSPGARRAWLRLAQVAAALALTVGIAPTHAAPVSSAHNSGHVYIMSNRKKRRKQRGTQIAAVIAHLLHGGSHGTAPHPFALAV